MDQGTLIDGAMRDEAAIPEFYRLSEKLLA